MGYIILKEFLLSDPELKNFKIDIKSLQNKIHQKLKNKASQDKKIDIKKLYRELKRDFLINNSYLSEDSQDETENLEKKVKSKSIFVNVGWIPQNFKEEFLVDKENEFKEFGEVIGLVKRREETLYESDRKGQSDLFFIDLEKLSERSSFDNNKIFYLGIIKFFNKSQR